MDRQLQSSTILINLLSHLFQTVSNHLTHEKTCSKEMRDNSVAEDNPKTRRPHQLMPSTAKGPGTIKPIPDTISWTLSHSVAFQLLIGSILSVPPSLLVIVVHSADVLRHKHQGARAAHLSIEESF